MIPPLNIILTFLKNKLISYKGRINMIKEIYTTIAEKNKFTFPCPYKEYKNTSINYCINECKNKNNCDVFATMLDEANDVQK